MRALGVIQQDDARHRRARSGRQEYRVPELRRVADQGRAFDRRLCAPVKKDRPALSAERGARGLVADESTVPNDTGGEPEEDGTTIVGTVPQELAVDNQGSRAVNR